MDFTVSMTAHIREGIRPPHPSAIDEDNPAQYPSIIEPWPAVRLREEVGKLGRQLVFQPIKVVHIFAPFVGALNYAALRKS